jgi:hypothetical protein
MLYGQLYADSDPAQSHNSLCTVYSNMENILFEHFTILLSDVLARNATIILCRLTAWSRVLFQKLIGLWLVKKFPAFCGTWRSLLTCLQDPVTCPYPEKLRIRPEIIFISFLVAFFPKCSFRSVSILFTHI